MNPGLNVESFRNSDYTCARRMAIFLGIDAGESRSLIFEEET